MRKNFKIQKIYIALSSYCHSIFFLSLSMWCYACLRKAKKFLSFTKILRLIFEGHKRSFKKFTFSFLPEISCWCPHVWQRMTKMFRMREKYFLGSTSGTFAIDFVLAKKWEKIFKKFETWCRKVKLWRNFLLMSEGYFY